MGRVYNIFIAIFSAIGSFLFGYDSGIIATVIAFTEFEDFVNDSDNYSSLSGAVVSTFTGGCFFGTIIAGYTCDKIGRKRTIQAGALLDLVGCALQAGANNLACMLVGRIIAGFAIGMLSMTVPLYNTEIAPPKIRGFMVGVTQQMIGIGAIVANWVGYGCSFIPSYGGWRLALGIQLIPAFLLFVGINFLPFSPRWLLEKGRNEEARQIVYTLYGVDTPEAKEAADVEFNQMETTIKAEMIGPPAKLSDLWETPAMLKRTLVASGVQIFGQFSGINVINYFGPSMYESLGLTTGQSLLVQGIYGAVGPIANFIFITLIIDLVGRKKPLLFGASSFVLTYSILTAIVARFPPGVSENHPAQRAGIAMIYMTSIFFSLSFGPVSWVLTSEVFPTRVRALGTCVAVCCNWAFNVLFSQVSDLAIDSASWKYYLLFILLNAMDFVLILVFFPETRGKTLEEMAEVFGDEVDPLDVLAQGHAHEKLEQDTEYIEA